MEYCTYLCIVFNKGIVKMRNLDIIVKEIVALSEIKSAYNHYLSSHRSLTEVENTTQIQDNSITIAQSLIALYGELSQVRQLQKESATSPYRQSPPRTVVHSEVQKNAILHFNRDRRFTITE